MLNIIQEYTNWNTNLKKKIQLDNIDQEIYNVYRV